MSRREKIVFFTSVMLGLIVMVAVSAAFASSDDVLIAVTGEQTGSSHVCCAKGHGTMHPAIQLAAHHQTINLLDWFK